MDDRKRHIFMVQSGIAQALISGYKKLWCIELGNWNVLDSTEDQINVTVCEQIFSRYGL